MPVHKPHITDSGVYFLTFTNYKWLPLFEITNSYDLVYKWFDYLKSKNHHIVGYVTMPNHLHALIAFKVGTKSINTIIGNGKRFIAYDIVKRLNEQGRADILSILSGNIQPLDRQRGKLHEVFEPSFDMKICHGFDFINQKLEYMHNNPVSKKWVLAENRTSYPHSSAAYYDKDVQGFYEVTNYMKLI